ncbi:hypothetical protein DFA_08676 [Cavenderia fasciculata]|uniref:Uncharacterized protein n=1 Tax=Cavenderia fasciculata TaxID=261658 RepID=F4Q3M2_CACFS|nr:uncharacterized protein DFA_08676 [Cavenderia fasciculata]EGG17680.1 hypothetical protein DFA_08676 [Cavenderia fasciculata]|eukprot:XP_004356164.1 hypothetical protein DFA_08676 [Cavenderia fasciculata]
MRTRTASITFIITIIGVWSGLYSTTVSCAFSHRFNINLAWEENCEMTIGIDPGTTYSCVWIDGREGGSDRPVIQVEYKGIPCLNKKIFIK